MRVEITTLRVASLK